MQLEDSAELAGNLARLSWTAVGRPALRSVFNSTFDMRHSTLGLMAGGSRTERDSMGEMAIPADAYYGAQTARAVENFPISDLRFPREFIRALGLIKKHAAITNSELGSL